MAIVAPTPLPSKDPAEVLYIGFDLGAVLAAGESIVAHAVAVSTRSGTDPAPEAILDGAPSRDAALIAQRVRGGIDGAAYLLRCTVDTSAGRVLVLAGVLPIRALR